MESSFQVAWVYYPLLERHALQLDPVDLHPFIKKRAQRLHATNWVCFYYFYFTLITSNIYIYIVLLWLRTELWALRDDLILCKDLGLEAIEVELDAKVVVDWVDGLNCPSNYYSSLMAYCHKWSSTASMKQINVLMLLPGSDRALRHWSELMCWCSY